MYITRAIIVDAGAAYVQDPLYDDKVKIRIPTIHGYGQLVRGFQEDVYTKDEDLPWGNIIVTSINKDTKYPIVQYKAQNYAPADMVYVQYDETSANPDYMVIGIYAKYNDDEADMTTTIYNNIDVSSIISNKVEFPDNLKDPSGGNEIVSDSGDDDDTPSEDGASEVVNKTEYKYVFGNPFKKSSDYRISATFPKYRSGKPHSGIDLAGPQGTPIYAIGDGTVIKSGYGDMTGNCVIIKHKPYKKKTYYSMYEHMQKTPKVKVGDSVKGTQLIADTDWVSAYKKTLLNTFVQLKHKPKDWDYGGWKSYYKKSGDNYVPVGDKAQKGTQLGVRGTTGNSTGPHLHFGMTTKEGYYWNASVSSGYMVNPQNYITF